MLFRSNLSKKILISQSTTKHQTTIYYIKKLFNLFNLSQHINYKTKILSSLTITITLIPKTIAFTLITKLSPLTKLYTTFIIKLITSILNSHPNIISKTTNTITIIITTLTLSHNIKYIFTTIILTKLIQILTNILKLNKLIHLIPHPIIFKFINNLTIIIFISQLKQFKTPKNT